MSARGKVFRNWRGERPINPAIMKIERRASAARVVGFIAILICSTTGCSDSYSNAAAPRYEAINRMWFQACICDPFFYLEMPDELSESEVEEGCLRETGGSPMIESCGYQVYSRYASNYPDEFDCLVRAIDQQAAAIRDTCEIEVDLDGAAMTCFGATWTELRSALEECR